MTSKDVLINKIENIVYLASKFKNSYFFSPPSNSYARRRYEEQYSVKVVEWMDGGNAYTAEFNVQCSCHNVYAKGAYTKNGKKTNLTAIKNSLARLASSMSEQKEGLK